MPNQSEQYNGIDDQRPVDVHSKDGKVSVFVLGDWGAPWDHMAFGGGGPVQAQVATAMKNRAKWADPQYVLNVGDNFYVDGVHTNCNEPPSAAHGTASAAFSHVWQEMYGSLASKPWLSVLGNHDYGGWRFDSGWPQQIGYSFINHNWIMPARYFSKRISHSDFVVDYFMMDSNAFDAKNLGEDDGHNICGSHSPWQGCEKNGGMANHGDCKGWFWRTYKESKKWLEAKLAASDARWKVVVTHFPCGYDAEWYKMLQRKYGLDLLVTGHRHQQELWNLDTPSRYVQHWLKYNKWDETAPACFVTGGGGGIHSEAFFYADYGRDLQWFGFFHLTISRDNMIIELVDTRGWVQGNMTIYPHGLNTTTGTSTRTGTTVTTTSATVTSPAATTTTSSSATAAKTSLVATRTTSYPAITPPLAYVQDVPSVVAANASTVATTTLEARQEFENLAKLIESQLVS